MKNTFEASHDRNKSFKSRTVTLAAGDSKAVGVGAYQSAIAGKDFVIAVEPNNTSGCISATLEVVEIPGSSRFLGFYNLYNAGDRSCDVTITYRTPSGVA